MYMTSQEDIDEDSPSFTPCQLQAQNYWISSERTDKYKGLYIYQWSSNHLQEIEPELPFSDMHNE